MADKIFNEKIPDIQKEMHRETRVDVPVRVRLDDDGHKENCMCCGWFATIYTEVTFKNKYFKFCEHCWKNRRTDCFKIYWI